MTSPRLRLELQKEDNGWVICADEHGIAWGEGKSGEQAVDDWRRAATEIRDMLRRAQGEPSPMMAHRLSLLESWASEGAF